MTMAGFLFSAYRCTSRSRWRHLPKLRKAWCGQSHYLFANENNVALAAFSSTPLPSSEDSSKKNKVSFAQSVIQSEHLDAAARSMGQVIFLNSVHSGRVVFASLAVGDPTLAALALLGTTTANTTSHLIGLDNNAWKNGLWGYNGALIGCAACVFGPAYLPFKVASTVIGAAATPVLSASLNSAVSMPQWTWSFNVVALTSLLRARPLLLPAESVDANIDVVSASTGFSDVTLSPLKGLSQIFVVDSLYTGAGIAAATYLYSPKLAVHAVGGSAIGCLVGLLSGADLSDVCMGLWGYNSALTSMAVGVFFVHSRHTMALSASSAAASAVLFGAMQTLFGTYGVPCLTLPFCSVASACYLLEGQIPGLKLAAEPHSPEKNV